ncbi:MAG: hypothetical protein WDA16_05935 [Candidatus Thermoplasmatota archaeon]
MVAVGSGSTLAAIGAAIGAALLAFQLYREAKEAPKAEAAGASAPSSRALPGGETTSSVPTVIPVFMPQDRPGPVDSGGPSTVFALPPGMTPQDVADWYASRGQAHDAGPVINIYQGGSTVTPTPEADGPAQPTPTGTGGVPLDGTTPTPPATPPPPDSAPGPREPEPTHEDILGRRQPGPPSDAEIAGKAAFGYGGGLILESLGTAKIAAGAAGGAARVGLAGPVAVGLGIGLQATQVLQDVGFFDNVVKPAGAAASERLGEGGSKAVATGALVLSVPGAVIKAAVTPGESVVGNVRTAVDKSYLPEAGAAIQSGAAAARGALSAAERKLDALRGDIWSGVSSAARVGGDLGGGVIAKVSATASAAQAVGGQLAQAGGRAVAAGQALAGDVGQKFNDTGAAGKAAVGDIGQKFNQGAAAVGGLFTKRWF